MDQYIFFALAAVVLAGIRYGIYFYKIYKGETKPHGFSWLLWAVVGGIGAFAQFSLDGGPSAWVLAFVSFTCLVIAVLSHFIGDKNHTRSDWAALLVCFMAIPLWQLTSNPVAALALIIFVDGLTYFPTVRKSFNKPYTEPAISYVFGGMRYFLMLFAVPDPTWQTLLYPFFVMITDWGFAIFILIRRWQLEYQSHKYAHQLVKHLH